MHFSTVTQCFIATRMSSVHTSSPSHQLCTVASRNVLIAFKSLWFMAFRASTAISLKQSCWKYTCCFLSTVLRLSHPAHLELGQCSCQLTNLILYCTKLQLFLFSLRTQPHNVCQERRSHAYDPAEGLRALEEFLVSYNNHFFMTSIIT